MTLERVRGGFRDRVRLGGGKRPWVTLSVTSETIAKDRFARLRAMTQRLTRAKKLDAIAGLLRDAVAAAGDAREFAGIEQAARDLCVSTSAVARPITVRELAEQFTTGDLHRRYPRHVDKGGKSDETRKREKQRLETLCAVIGDIAVADLTLEDAERAIDVLPKTLTQGSRRVYEQVLFHLLKIARYPLKLIEVSPIPPEFVSPQGKPAATPFLYPLEEAQLQRYAPPAPGALELEQRLLFGVACREGFRPSGVALLMWEHLDLVRGTVTHQNKTMDSRMWTLDESVARALRAWRQTCKGPHVFPSYWLPEGTPGGNGVTRRKKLAGELQAGLEAAGVTRRDLHHERTKLRRSIRAHDMRTSFVTLALADGRGEAWVMARTGHTESGMLKKYKRLVATAAELNLGWWLPLDELLGLIAPPPGVGHGMGHGPRKTEGNGMHDATPCNSPGASGSLPVRQTPVNRRYGDASGHLAVAHAAGVGHGDQTNGAAAVTGDAKRVNAVAPADPLEIAVRLAAEAGEWQVVAELSAILVERRTPPSPPLPPGVPSLDAARKRKGGE